MYADYGITGGLLFIMGPHADDLDHLDIIQDLVDHSMLYIDPSRTGAGQIADRHLVLGLSAIGVLFENIEGPLSLRL